MPEPLTPRVNERIIHRKPNRMTTQTIEQTDSLERLDFEYTPPCECHCAHRGQTLPPATHIATFVGDENHKRLLCKPCSKRYKTNYGDHVTIRPINPSGGEVT